MKFSNLFLVRIVEMCININHILFSSLFYSTSVVVSMEEVGDLEGVLGVIVGMEVGAVEVNVVVEQHLEELVVVDLEEVSMVDQVVAEVLVEVVVLRPAIL